MKDKNIERIVKSTVHIVMCNPQTIMPDGIGSGCIINYKGREILLTAAHVTDKQAATCISTGLPPVNARTPLYSVGAMNYLQKFNINEYEKQIEILKEEPERIEEVDFGLIDFSFVPLKEKVSLIQKEVKFQSFTIKESEKSIINSDLTAVPTIDSEFGFFGRIKPLHFKGTPQGDVFETQETFYAGLKFIRKIKNYYEFELPTLIQDHTDFRGTSGAPIMDQEGNLVSLVTHGYTGGNKIYGIALADFKVGVDATLLNYAPEVGKIN